MVILGGKAKQGPTHANAQAPSTLLVASYPAVRLPVSN